MLSTLRELSEDPGLHGRYLYTGLHCERCQKDREKRWGQEWDRQEREYQERLLELRALPYEEYLRSAHWRRRRTEKLEGAGHAGVSCAVPPGLPWMYTTGPTRGWARSKMVT
jgi:hypothetical protein